jgi:hypothetical protein
MVVPSAETAWAELKGADTAVERKPRKTSGVVSAHLWPGLGLPQRHATLGTPSEQGAAIPTTTDPSRDVE